MLKHKRKKRKGKKTTSEMVRMMDGGKTSYSHAETLNPKGKWEKKLVKYFGW